MAKKNQDIVFRRIRGRIVPIKRKRSGASKRKKEILKGAALITSGSILAGGLGFGSGKLLRSAAQQGRTIQQLSLFAETAQAIESSPKFSSGSNALGTKFLREAGRRLPKFKATTKLSKSFLNLSGSIFAGAIVGEGISRVATATKKRNLTATEEITADLSGFVSTAIAHKSFKTGLGQKAIRKILSKGKL